MAAIRSKASLCLAKKKLGVSEIRKILGVKQPVAKNIEEQGAGALAAPHGARLTGHLTSALERNGKS